MIYLITYVDKVIYSILVNYKLMCNKLCVGLHQQYLIS